MNYNIKNLKYEDAVSRITDFDYALLYQLSGIRLCRTKQLTENDWAECVEARLFGDGAELHLFPLYEKRVVLISDESTGAEGHDTVETDYLLSGRFRKTGWTKVKVKRYLCADEDGQMYVALTRLTGLE